MSDPIHARVVGGSTEVTAGAGATHGAYSTVEIGTTTTGEPGTSASVTNTGTKIAAVLNFTIPKGATGATGAQGEKGDTGDAATIAVGSVTSGDTVSVTNSGTSHAAVFDFVLKKGDKGDTGAKGDKGDTGDTGATGAKGDKGDKGDTGEGIASGGTTGQILQKKSATDYDTEWVDKPTSAVWGSITGTLSNQTDLNTALTAKYEKPAAGIPDSDIASASTWNAKQDALPTVTNDRYLHTNASTGALEWVAGSGGGGTWGSITGTLSSQTDLQSALDAKAPTASPVFTGSISMGREANTTVGSDSVAEGGHTTASAYASHAEGFYTTASESYSHAEGNDTTASGSASHSEGYDTTASGDYSHAEGNGTTASGKRSHAEGYNTNASNDYTHAEGYVTTASGSISHAEGSNTTASAYGSHAEGNHTESSGTYSHAEGGYTTASGNYSHVQGKYNVNDSSGTYADIVGGGTATNARKNISALDWNGNLRLKGNVYVGCNDDSTGGTTLGTYSKPSGGIPSTDMTSAVQTSLGLADTALQSVPSTYRTSAAQDVIDAGKVSTSDYAPETKTSAMTQAVGKDSDGKLWTTPGSSGTVTSVSVKMNGTTKGTVTTSGEIDLEDVVTKISAGTGITTSTSGGQALISLDSAYKQFTEAEKTKLSGIATGAEVNVQSNWNETDTAADSYIQNKPTIPTVPTNVSAFTNDAGYLTTHQSKSDLGLGNVDNTSDATKKTNFTGSIASGNTGFVTGGDVYTAIGNVETLLAALR